MNVFDVLQKDHDEIRDYSSRLEFCMDPRERIRLLGLLKAILQAHSELEENAFYPSLTGDDSLKEWVDLSYQDHEEMKRLTQELMEENLDELLDIIEQHLDDEEEELFPRIKNRFDTVTLEEMGERLQLYRSNHATDTAA